ncbi:MAG: hypothetical protein OIN66_09990 [Candidatus Methanoperedens sp.]|nr:hypothetical protein [Candidatus Methanoperedens sp.]
MSTEYMKVLKSQLSHGLEFEKKYIASTINKMLRVELGMVKKEIKQVMSTLVDFEKRYKMNSDKFYEKFNAGELGDDREYIKWYAYKDTYNKLTERSKEIERVVNV